MPEKRKRSEQVNFACPKDMIDALDILSIELRLDGRTNVVRHLLADAINRKFKDLNLPGRVSEKDRPEEKKS